MKTLGQILRSASLKQQQYIKSAVSKDLRKQNLDCFLKAELSMGRLDQVRTRPNPKMQARTRPEPESNLKL